MDRGVERRQAFDLPERAIAVAERRSAVYCFGACGEFPAWIASPAQY
jgi:hypothetical protein